MRNLYILVDFCLWMSSRLSVTISPQEWRLWQWGFLGCCLTPRPLLLLRSLSQGSTNSNLLDVQGNHKKRVRRSSLLNAKKLYEDAQMARKVKQYLAHLEVETDEEKFQIMSLQCEAAYSTRAYTDQHRSSLQGPIKLTSPAAPASDVLSEDSHCHLMDKC